MNVPFDRGQDHGALAALIRLLHERLEVGDRSLHGLGGLEDEGQLHLARGEALAHDLHALEQDVVDDAQGSQARIERLGQVAIEPVAIAVDDALAEPTVHRPVEVLVCRGRRDGDPLVQGEQLGQRVVALAPAVVHEVQADLAGPLVDPGQRQDLRGVHDGRVQPGLDALVQEDRVEDLACRGVEAERHVGEPEHGGHAGKLGLDAPDALDCLDAVLSALLHAGREGQGERVEDQVVRLEPVAMHGDVVDLAGGAHFPLCRARLPLLVDAGAHHGGPELAGEPQECVEAGARRVAFLEVDRVENGSAPEPLECGAHHGPLGRVHHERHARLGAQSARHLGHVGHAVGAGVVDAHVDQMGALVDLVAGNGHTGVPVAGQHGLAERLGPVGVGAFAHHEEGGVLAEGDRGVDRRRRSVVRGLSGRRHHHAAPVDHGGHVSRRGPAAASHGRHAELGDEAVEVVGQLVGGQVVVHLAIDHRRESRVRNAGNGDPAGRRQVTECLAHLHGPRGAVQADYVDSEGVEHGQGGANLGSGQHAARQLDGHLRLEWDDAVQRRHGAPRPVYRGLDAQEVELRLDQEEVDAALEEAQRLFLVGVAELGVGDLPQGGELGSRPHGTGHPTGPFRGGELVAHRAGQLGRGAGQRPGPMRQPVLGQHDRGGAEGVGLGHVATNLVEGAVHLGHQVGPGLHQDLVAPLQVVAPEVVRAEPEQLEVGPHGSVEDQHALVERTQVARCGRVESAQQFGRRCHDLTGYWPLPGLPERRR